MIFRIFSLLIRQFVLCSTLLASIASAQTQPPINLFFGSDFVLHPIAIKWACGGQSDQDLSQIAVLMAAFPKEAERAELQNIVDALLEASEREAGLSEILGAELSNEQVERLCIAARPLSIEWATPEQLANDDEDGVPQGQRVAWEAFHQVVEELQ